MGIPSFMIAAASSGSGKTVISCGLMAAFRQSGLKVAACKCGPDYIDPMFHREVLGIDSENLDLFFYGKEILEELFERHAENADITMIEGVMGYYDGMALASEKASSYDVARTLKTPVILVVSCKGAALSVLPVIQGMIGFKEDSNICGILLNRVSSMLYPKMKQMIEEGLAQAGYAIPVIGYVPEHPVFGLESRHLGLVTPQEISSIRERLEEAGRLLSETVELDTLLSIAACSKATENRKGFSQKNSKDNGDVEEGILREKKTVRIAVAQDEAFCFYYKDNLQFLQNEGCELVEFSPLHDNFLPEDIQGMILGGGYPELYTKDLERNVSMRSSIKEAILGGLPCLAECGGFMYLHEEMEDDKGSFRQMTGVFPGKAFHTGKLVRFGYIEIEAQKEGAFLKKGEKLRGHEFHYWDSTDNGKDCIAVKPDKRRSWECIHMEGNLFAGYPHIHFYSNLEFARRFILEAKKERQDDSKIQ
ncbi:cobyrinate a,c-diamide synthase [Faecalicatena contorta]|uniref:Cobyrinate a,c-diamide synthase n=1 Tax=Faecalicatena contorta TaxID=39482 RepID=A0A316APZ3_9FIRM|nr:cobyrinate a,c-diamide synthase [Faecalicatena contorta]PWJ52157.1 cobyrinic acid a,c-diamide synthase [Faecalicatena contorta]SUQ12435.1 cobyrinic acid a,c-diamide synthase [Faecalicatena contorta]